VEALTGALFVAVALIAGPHRTVPAYCVLSATFVALAAIELDRQPSPAGVSVVGAVLALALFVWPAAGAVGWHAFVLALVAGAGAVVSAVLLRAATTDVGDDDAAGGAPFALVPLGILLGWLGEGSPAAAVVGAGVALGAAAVAGLVRGRAAPGGVAAGVRRWSLGFPLGCGAGAVVAFALAAGQGALNGG